MTEPIEAQVCTGPCGESKPIFAFQLRSDGRGGTRRDSRCKDCVSKLRPYTPGAVRKQEAGKFYANDPWGHKRRAARKLALKSKK